MNLSWIADVLRAIIDGAGLVGAFLVILFLFFLIAARYQLFPKLSRQTFSALAIMTLVLFVGMMVLVIVWPTFERRILGVQTIDVLLKGEDNALASVDFVLRYRISDRGVLDTTGSRGVAEVRGAPAGLKQLDVVGVEAAGWLMRDLGPFQVIDGEVDVIMRKSGPVPPPDDTGRPDPSVFMPERDELLREPTVKPTEVTLHYRNATGHSLHLVLHPYFIGDKQPRKLVSKWLDFPMESHNQFYDKFERGNGWYGIWVRDPSDRYWPLGAHNLFVASQVWLIVEKTILEKEKPYQIRITATDSDNK